MAIITAFRFSERSGAVCVDQESWHIFRRKNWFTDHLYPLVSEKHSQRYNVSLIYGGAGHPPFHHEVQAEAKRRIGELLANNDLSPEEITVPNLSRHVLDAFRHVHRRRVNDALLFLFGFDLDDYNAGYFMRNGKKIPIRRKEVLERAGRIVSGKEFPGYGPFTPPVEACLIGLDQKYGFSAFVLKESDGVLAFQSCWFESLGQGRDGAAIRFAKHLNGRFLDSRREGDGDEPGLFVLLDAICESMEHYGQDGGFVRYMILDGTGDVSDKRLIDIRDDAARLSMEIVRAVRASLLERSSGEALLSEIVSGGDIGEIECRLFRSVSDPHKLGYLLRGYKIREDGLPSGGPEEALFTAQCAAVSGEESS